MNEPRVRQIEQTINDWLSKKRLCDIDVRSDKPPMLQGSDYHVAYETTFSPKSLQKPLLQVTVTSGGHVGIGIERWKRISTRLGVSCVQDKFAGGSNHEAWLRTNLSKYAISSPKGCSRYIHIMRLVS